MKAYVIGLLTLVFDHRTGQTLFASYGDER